MMAMPFTHAETLGMAQTKKEQTLIKDTDQEMLSRLNLSHKKQKFGLE